MTQRDKTPKSTVKDDGGVRTGSRVWDGTRGSVFGYTTVDSPDRWPKEERSWETRTPAHRL